MYSLLGFPQSAITETLEIQNEPTWREHLKELSDRFGADYYLVERTIWNESNGIHEAVGDNGLSRGIAQIQEPTWEWLEGKYNKEYDEDLEYTSEYDQLKLTTWSIANGYGNNWTAYRCIKNGGTYSFYSKQLGKYFNITCEL